MTFSLTLLFLIEEKNKNMSKGLGDTIEKITKATGIKKAVEAVAGKDCGCNKRRDTLNRAFPYNND